jgi:fission process protein 1
MMWPWSKSSENTPPPPPPKTSPPENNPLHNAPPQVKKAAGEFDPTKLPEREKLPAKLQKIVDKSDQDDFFDDLVDG